MEKFNGYYGLQRSQSNFRAYINKKLEFKQYFGEGKHIISSCSSGVRYEINPGEPAQ